MRSLRKFLEFGHWLAPWQLLQGADPTQPEPSQDRINKISQELQDVTWAGPNPANR